MWTEIRKLSPEDRLPSGCLAIWVSASRRLPEEGSRIQSQQVHQAPGKQVPSLMNPASLRADLFQELGHLGTVLKTLTEMRGVCVLGALL